MCVPTDQSSSGLYRIPLVEYTIIYLSILMWVDIWIVSKIFFLFKNDAAVLFLRHISWGT